jgi:hypothetical protein
MNQRFTLTQDGTVHVEKDDLTYVENKANFIQDAQTANLAAPIPEMPFPLTGFEITPDRFDFILENGWHYPMSPEQREVFKPYLGIPDFLSNLLDVRARRLKAAEVQPTDLQP